MFDTGECIRHSGKEHSHTSLQQPQQRGVETPSKDLRFTPADSQSVFLRVRVEGETLLVRHGVVGETHPPSADAVGGGGFKTVDYLPFRSGSACRQEKRGTHPSNRHQVIIQLEVLEPDGEKAGDGADGDGDDGKGHQSKGFYREIIGASHVVLSWIQGQWITET